ncbi:hypothetical protein AAFF_G00279780 [Aldrovandia affinis]|uniref:Zona pellucida sperm-binding protein 4 n=1 Tax=Aldrovandia affinis TaxID=143900 RepID=A0AAD7SRB1_9TELE|nr:hypothetical protein AAFF_G00279780 [Aldrovandia affinis]
MANSRLSWCNGLLFLFFVSDAVFAQKDAQKHLGSEVNRCLIDPHARSPCGDPNISGAECAALDCCFDGHSCYYGIAVTVHCTRDGHFAVMVAQDSTLPPLNLGSIRLLGGDGAPPCGPGVANTGFAFFQFPVTGCGTIVKEEGDHLIYENLVSSLYEYGTGHLGSITRDTDYALLIRCRYQGSEVLALGAEVKRLSLPPVPVTVQGPLRVELRLANGQCGAKGCSEVDVYSSYYAEADYPVTKVLQEPVYVEVRVLERSDPDLVLQLEHCWATSSPSPVSLPQWSLLVDGCPYRDDRYRTTVVHMDHTSGLPNPTHYKRFIFQMFTFVDHAYPAPLTEMVFIHCSTAVCHSSSADRCEQRCGRLRRAVAVQKSVSMDAVVVSSGEVMWSDHKLPVSDLQILDPEVPQFLSYGLLGLAVSIVLAVAVLVLAVTWRRRHRLQTVKL